MWKGHELDKYDEKAENFFSDVEWQNLKQTYHDFHSKFETLHEFFKSCVLAANKVKLDTDGEPIKTYFDYGTKERDAN